MSQPTQRSALQRRWPPIVAAVVSAVLVFLVLPNPLSIPQTNPSASAEYAPVPGDAQQAQSANFSETSEATSAGVGAGGDSVGPLPGTPAQQIPEFKPRQKSCVGNPPRQTEDPLSPPCVPFFEGENGGETYSGVTKDDIVVIFYNDDDIEGDLNKPWSPSDEGSCPQAPYECENIVRTIKAQLRYFQRRYQTYGRTVRLIGQASSGGLTSSCAARQGDAQTILREREPFAAVLFTGEAQCYNEEMARNDVPTFGLQFDVQRKAYEKFGGLIWGFFPDQETEAAYSASFICRKLVGNPARFAGDANLRDNERTFGFIRPQNSQRGPGTEQLADLLEANVKAECGLTFDEVDTYDASGAGAGGREASGIMSKYKQREITTVICYCIPVRTELTVSQMHSTANAVDYHPEWYWDHASAMDRGIWQQTYASPNQPGYGVSYLWRAPAFREQHHYQAYLQEEPGSQPNVRFNFSIYHLFLNLFQAIQAAGPDLTPATVRQGMFTFNYTDTADPWSPTGGYGPWGRRAVSDYTFVDSAMGWWWDPDGTPPGGRPGEGCIRVINQGLRAFTGTWPSGDADLFRDSDPCTQDTRKLADPSTSGTV